MLSLDCFLKLKNRARDTDSSNNFFIAVLRVEGSVVTSSIPVHLSKAPRRVFNDTHKSLILQVLKNSKIPHNYDIYSHGLFAFKQLLNLKITCLNITDINKRNNPF